MVELYPSGKLFMVSSTNQDITSVAGNLTANAIPHIFFGSVISTATVTRVSHSGPKVGISAHDSQQIAGATRIVSASPEVSLVHPDNEGARRSFRIWSRSCATVTCVVRFSSARARLTSRPTVVK